MVMHDNGSDENMQGLLSALRERKPKRILLQVPEGLRMQVIAIAAQIERDGIEVVISCDATYGACDLADQEAQRAGCDLLVHVGHVKFYRDFDTTVPVLYAPWKIRANIPAVDFSRITGQRIGIVCTVQHTGLLPGIHALLAKAGKQPVYAGTLLGCCTLPADTVADKIDAILYAGSGKFHPLAVRGKPVYTLDVETGTLEKLDTAVWERRRFARIFQAKDARAFGIIISSKEGQRELLGSAHEIKKTLEEKGKKAFILVMDEVSNAKLEGLHLDAYVNTACPRIADDRFTKPLLNAEDLAYLLAEESAISRPIQ